MPSAAIRSISYDAPAKRLTIVFQTGRRYAYYNVPPGIHSAFRIAPSRGAYFNTWIRDQYPYVHLADSPERALPRLAVASCH